MYTKIKTKHEQPIIPIQTNKMLHFLPNYFFRALKKMTPKTPQKPVTTRVHTKKQKNMQCYTGVTFSGIHINKMHRDKPSRKKKRKSRHIPTPHVDSARHSDVTNVTFKSQFRRMGSHQ